MQVLYVRAVKRRQWETELKCIVRSKGRVSPAGFMCVTRRKRKEE